MTPSAVSSTSAASTYTHWPASTASVVRQTRRRRPAMANSRIVTAEELEAILNASTNDIIKDAVKALFKQGDIIEVRAWDKDHNVYTGRYKYGTKLVRTLEWWDAEGCDIYYVLNPVGSSHGLREMS